MHWEDEEKSYARGVIGYRRGQLGALQPIIVVGLTKVVLNWSRPGHGEQWVNMFCVRGNRAEALTGRFRELVLA